MMFGSSKLSSRALPLWPKPQSRPTGATSCRFLTGAAAPTWHLHILWIAARCVATWRGAPPLGLRQALLPGGLRRYVATLVGYIEPAAEPATQHWVLSHQRGRLVYRECSATTNSTTCWRIHRNSMLGLRIRQRSPPRSVTRHCSSFCMAAAFVSVRCAASRSRALMWPLGSLMCLARAANTVGCRYRNRRWSF